jgi:glycosyltransferase involved in cell wall biosynthesis
MRFVIASLGFHPDVVGGAWRVAAAQATGLARRGHTVHVVTAQPDVPRPTPETRDGFIVHRFPQGSGRFHANWRAENAAARKLLASLTAGQDAAQPTLLLQHHPYLGPATDVIPDSVPILHVFHGPWAREYRFAQTARPRRLGRRCLDVVIEQVLHRVEARTLRRARQILTLSRHFAQRLRSWHPGRLPPVEVAHGGADLQHFAPLPEPERLAARQAYGLAPGDTLFLALRRLDPRMGLDVLLESFAQVVGRHPQARLWLTGRGPAESSLKNQIQRLGIDASVRLLGFVPEAELPRLLNAADLAVMPSLDLEGFGLATAEALACGTPVLGSHAGATPELLEPLDPSLLFPPASVSALARCLDNALSRSNTLPSRARCAAYARESFSWDAQIDACERHGAGLTSVAQPLAA